jgi:hypothetical protein
MFVGPTCDKRPFAAVAAGSCRPLEGADQLQMTTAINWVCSNGGVDCSPMRELCASAPLRERATWAFTVYAATHDTSSSCSFAGIAELSSVPLAEAAPSCDIGICRYPSSNLWHSPIFTGLLLLLALAYGVMRVRASRRLEREWDEALGHDLAHQAGGDGPAPAPSPVEQAARAPGDGAESTAAGGAAPVRMSSTFKGSGLQML